MRSNQFQLVSIDQRSDLDVPLSLNKYKKLGNLNHLIWEDLDLDLVLVSNVKDTQKYIILCHN